MLGSVTSANFSIPTASWLPRDNINSFYAQDDWRVTPKLTVNIGVRYVNESPWHTKYGQWSGFNPNAPDPVVPGDMGEITHPGGAMVNRHNLNFEPRIGIAWHPLDKLVIRSGFALMHIDLGLAPSELQEYSIATTQSAGIRKSHAYLPDQPRTEPDCLSAAPIATIPSPIRAAPQGTLPASAP